MMGPLLVSVTSHVSVRKLQQSLIFLDSVPFSLLTANGQTMKLNKVKQ